MSQYAISYDLRKPGRNYKSLTDAIKNLGGGWCHALESLWIVNTHLSVTQVRDRLLPHIDSNDGLMVNQTTGASAWYGIGKEQADWLKSA
jgi:hypothetical protein